MRRARHPVVKEMNKHPPSSPLPSTDKIGAVIVAAGDSKRMRKVDKIFAPIVGKPLLAHTVDTFQNCTPIDQIVILLNEKNLERGRTLAKEREWSKVTRICPGGQHRQDSVAIGLSSLKDCRWVVIHDGARPCVTTNLIESVIGEALETGAAIAAVPVKDTIKVVKASHTVQKTPERDNLWVVQTPQVFRFDIIAKAHEQAWGKATDDATLVEQLGNNFFNKSLY